MQLYKLCAALAASGFLMSTAFSADLGGVDIHGFVSQSFFGSTQNNYIIEDSKKGSLEYHEMGLNFQTDVGSRIHVGAQLLSRDIGDYGNNRVDLDWAYGTFTAYDQLQISAGRVKTDFGLFGSIQDFDFLRTPALLPSILYSPGLRTIIGSIDGLKFTGNISLSSLGSMGYGVSIGRPNLSKQGSDMPVYTESIGLPYFKTYNTSYMIAPIIDYNTPIDGFRIKLGYLYGKAKIDSLGMFQKNWVAGMPTELGSSIQDINWFNAGVQFTKSIIDFNAEYYWVNTYNNSTGIRVKHPVLGWIDHSNLPMLPESITDTINRGGFYAALSVNPLSWFSCGTYYQYYDDQPILRSGKKRLADLNRYNKDFALTLKFSYKDYVTLKLEGHNVTGAALVESNLNDTPKNNWQYAVVKATYNF